jgi:ubiquinone biosynthesis protein
MTSPLRFAQFVVETRVRLTFQKDKKALGRHLRDEAVSFGAFGIKAAQFASTRPAFPAEIRDELALCQKNVPQAPFDAIVAVVEASLRQPLHVVFSEFEPDCVGSASLAQVYRARLRRSGRLVAVKVRRPGVAASLRADLASLRQVVDVFSFFSVGAELGATLRDLCPFLEAELDYTRELDNMVAFHAVLPTDGVSARVPAVCRALTTEEVLVMEYLPTASLFNTSAPRRTAERLLTFFVRQVTEMGVVHCDPHGGNVGLDADGETFVLYDFGNVVRLRPEVLASLKTLVFNIVQQDVPEFVDTLVRLKVITVKGADELDDVYSFFFIFFDFLATADFETLKTSVLQEKFARSNLDVQSDFLALFRAFALLDGTLQRLDPGFNYVERLDAFADDASGLGFFDAQARRDLRKMTSAWRQQSRNTIVLSKMQRKARADGDRTNAVLALAALALLATFVT